MKDDKFDSMVSSSVEDLGVDIASKLIVGKTKDYSKEVCEEFFGGGINGKIGNITLNILTGGSFQLLKWLGPVEKIATSIGAKNIEKKQKRMETAKNNLDKLDMEFAELVKQYQKEGISDSERCIISKKMEKVAKKQYQFAKKL